MRRVLTRNFLVALLIMGLLIPSLSAATIKWSNNATSVIANVGGITAGATTLTVTTGHGDRFPAVAAPHYFMATIVDGSGNREIVKVTARSSGSNVLTITRAQEGTTARAFAAGSLVELRVTQNALDYLAKSADIHEAHYVADASAVDQAATTNPNSVKSLLTAIGTSKKASIVLAHTGTGNDTAYTIGQAADWSSYANVTVKTLPGAVISYGSYAIQIPNLDMSAGGQLSGSGTVAISTSFQGSRSCLAVTGALTSAILPYVQAEWFSTLAAAEACAYASGKELRISTAYVMGANLTVRCALNILPGGSITHTSYTLDLSACPKFTGSENCFVGSGTVAGLKDASTSWWGTDVTAINAAIACSSASGGGTVTMPPTSYSLLSVAMKSNVKLKAYGATITKNAGAAGTHILDMTGATTATTTALSGNAAIGDTSLSVTSETGFAAGDYVLIYDSTYAYGTIGRNQELNRVASTSAGAIVVQNRLIGAYATASTATIVKLAPIVNASVEGGTWVIPAATNGGAIYGVLCYNCNVKDAIITGPNDDAGVQFEQSAYCSIEKSSIRDGQSLSSPGYGYGVAIGESSHNIDAKDINTQNVRENMITNGAKYVNVIGGTCVGSYDNGWNSHGAGVKYVTFTKPTIVSSRQYGISVGYSTHNAGDSDITIDSPVIVNSGYSAISVVAPADGTKDNNRIKIINPTIVNYGVVSVSSDGIGVYRANDVQVIGGSVKGVSTNAAKGVYFSDVVGGKVHGVDVSDIPNGYGIMWDTSSLLSIVGNNIHDISSHNLRSYGTANTLISVRNNVCDDSTVAQGSKGEQWTGNILGAIPSSFTPIETANGGRATINVASVERTIAAAASTATTTNILPAGALILAVSVRVETAIPTAATFTVTGDTSSTVFSTTGVATAAGSTDVGTAAGVYYNAAAQKVRITPNATPDAATGLVRITVWYIDITAPAS